MEGLTKITKPLTEKGYPEGDMRLKTAEYNQEGLALETTCSMRK
jgi:hypothetical protein